MWSASTRQLLDIACHEDLGDAGDLTAALLPGGEEPLAARIVVRQPGVLCGLALAPELCAVFARRLGAPLAVRPEAGMQDGTVVAAGTAVARLHGPRAAVLGLERTLLNFLGRLSGVATLTRRYVEAARAARPDVQVLDTRKTLPGWRELDKYAVRCGGGQNHRAGLYDAVLIKDNHLAGIPPAELADAVRGMLARAGPAARFREVEVDSLEQFEAVCHVPSVDIVLLDNFTPEQMRAAVRRRAALGLGARPALEASGGVRLEQVAEIAATGVDRISIGALTHSAASLDVGLDF